MTPMRRLLILIGILGGSGVVHLVKPEVYFKIVPPQVGDARRVVLASGMAELGCAAMLAAPQTRRLGALLSAGIFVGVFPANLYAVKALGDSKVGRIGAILRLPLQIPMITSALKVARESS